MEAREDILVTSDLTVTLHAAKLCVGRLRGASGLRAATWPLLKSLFGPTAGPVGTCHGSQGFFSVTQEEDETTLVLDARCRAAFEEVAPIATVEYAVDGALWRAFELFLGSLAWEVPGVTCFLSQLMADSNISILKLSSSDIDIILVQEADVAAATCVVREHLANDARGLQRSISQKTAESQVRRSASSADAFELEHALALAQIDEPVFKSGAAGSGHDGHDSPASGSAMASAAYSSPLRGSPSSRRFSRISSQENLAADAPRGAAASPQHVSHDYSSQPLARQRQRAAELRAQRASGALADLRAGGESIFVKVLAVRLAVVRLQLSMLRASGHALVQRLLFAPPGASFWSFTHAHDEISLVIDEGNLAEFPAEVRTASRASPSRHLTVLPTRPSRATCTCTCTCMYMTLHCTIPTLYRVRPSRARTPQATVGSASRFRALRLCGRSFDFDTTGVVSAMFAPYEEGLPLINVSTFSTNLSLVEDDDLERAVASFEIPVVFEDETELRAWNSVKEALEAEKAAGGGDGETGGVWADE